MQIKKASIFAAVLNEENLGFLRAKKDGLKIFVLFFNKTLQERKTVVHLHPPKE